MRKREYICTNCGYVGPPIKITPGSFLLEIVLWCFFLLPGILYSIWRLTSKYEACPKCKKPTLIPVDTPKGQKLLQELESQK